MSLSAAAQAVPGRVRGLETSELTVRQARFSTDDVRSLFANHLEQWYAEVCRNLIKFRVSCEDERMVRENA